MADIKDMSQGLLKRNPSMSLEEFSEHWYTQHAPIVVPFFLGLGFKHYEQIHGPLSSTGTSITESLNLDQFDGAAASIPPENYPSPLPSWIQAYYDEVIKPDERRFLITEALDHIFMVPAQSVTGERKVVIENGKAVIDVPESIWEVWRTYEKKKRASESEGKAEE